MDTGGAAGRTRTSGVCVTVYKAVAVAAEPRRHDQYRFGAARGHAAVDHSNLSGCPRVHDMTVSGWLAGRRAASEFLAAEWGMGVCTGFGSRALRAASAATCYDSNVDQTKRPDHLLTRPGKIQLSSYQTMPNSPDAWDRKQLTLMAAAIRDYSQETCLPLCLSS